MSEDEEHDELVAALQDVMLPTGIPVLPDVELAARYCLPGGAEEAVGNWFDVVDLPGGRLGMVVGESVGTGMAAAAAMGQVRAVLRAGLERHGDVVLALELGDTFAKSSEDARGTAVVVAVIDAAAGTLTYGTAGYPAPLVVSGGEGRSLPRSPAGWLGTGSSFTAIETSVSRGDLVLLTCSAPYRMVGSFPDVVGRTIVPGDTEATCDRIVSALVGFGGNDTLTLLAAELRTEPRPTFSLDLPAGEQAKRTGREHLATWLDEIHVPPMDAMAIVHAAAELVANAVEHAHAGRHSTSSSEVATMAQLRVHGELTVGGTVRIEVSDQGTWREPTDDDVARGRGLAMAAGLVDSLRVVTDSGGTHAVLTHRLSRPVHIERGPQAGHASLPVRAVGVDRPEPGAVNLQGAFGHDDVDRVTAELLLASRGGTREVRVDLAQVTYLASTAVRMFSDLVAGSGSAPVVLHAPVDSPAHRALDVACVPHDAA